MRLTRRGSRVVTVLAVTAAIAFVLTIALVPPGWWL